MNDNIFQPPSVNYPPNVADIENMQDYISKLETALNNGTNTQRQLQEYGSSLLLMSTNLERDRFHTEASKVQDLGDLAINALADL